MLSRRKLEQIQRRVTKELAENRMWKHLVDGRFWLCPYCGMVGANVEAVDHLPEMVTAHLVRQCTSWKNFEGAYVHIQKLDERALETMATHKLASDADWKLFDESGRWYCPYCAKGKPVEGLRSPEGMQNAKAAIVQHMRECHVFKGGRGVQMESQKLHRHVSGQNLISRLVPQIKRRLDGDDIWNKKWVDGAWVCPYCHKPVVGVDISTQITRSETAPRQMARHLIQDCLRYRKVPALEGQPVHVLRPVPGALQKKLVELMERMHSAPDESDGALDAIKSPEEPLPMPKLSIFGDGEQAPEIDSFGRGKVTMARYAADRDNSDTAEMAMRKTNPAKKSTTGKIEVQTGGAAESEQPLAVDDDPVDDPVAAETEDERLAAQLQAIDTGAADSITGRKRRALTGMMQRAKIRLMSMVPDVPRQYGLDVGVLFQPSKNFQGDFYYLHEPGQRKVGVAVYNLSVKGVDMVPLNELVLDHLKGACKTEPDPKAVLCRVNQELFKILDKEDYATMLYGVVDLEQKNFVFCNAGHVPPLSLNPFGTRDPEFHRSNGIVIGRDEGPMFQALLEPVTVSLDKRDVLILYTEGIIESVGGPRKKPFGTKGLVDTVQEYSKQDAHFLIDMLETTILEYLASGTQEDDLTVLAMRVQ